MSPASALRPLTLAGKFVSLEPLRAEHARPLFDAAGVDSGDIFRWIPYPMRTVEDFEAWVETAFAEQDRGESIVFVTREIATGELVGSTRFMNISLANRRVEIGSTWIIPRRQRTAVNTEAKYLMLRHAFETVGCVRVELKTDALNQKSRDAILRLGAKQEGIFRKHLITFTGRIRDTVYFSILDDEWPQVKAKLEGTLNRPRRP
jgi:RimJ/RimL family protein N-acetyltransferase